MKHLSPLRWLWLLVVIGVIVISAILLFWPSPAGGQGPTPYPTYLPPPAPIYRPTPRPTPCCYVYAPLLRGGSAAGIPEPTR